MYLVSIAFEAIGSFGVASARNVPVLFAFRFVQALGASSGLSVGTGVIGDVYKLEERGAANGVFSAVRPSRHLLLSHSLNSLFQQAVLLGAALAPFVSGIAASYYSWRGTQYGMGGLAIFCWILMLLLQPETSQPGVRGIEKAREAGKKDGWVWLNPLKSLATLRSPNVLFVVCLDADFSRQKLTDLRQVIEVTFVLLTDYGEILCRCVP